MIFGQMSPPHRTLMLRSGSVHHLHPFGSVQGKPATCKITMSPDNSKHPKDFHPCPPDRFQTPSLLIAFEQKTPLTAGESSLSERTVWSNRYFHALWATIPIHSLSGVWDVPVKSPQRLSTENPPCSSSALIVSGV